MRKVIIAGSRTFDSYDALDSIMAGLYGEGGHRKKYYIEVVSGGAMGADTLGQDWAIIHNLPNNLFLADWAKFGKRAGIIRNEKMGNYADELVAFWDGNSRGTKHMIDYMFKLKKPVHVYFFNIEDNNE